MQCSQDKPSALIKTECWCIVIGGDQEEPPAAGLNGYCLYSFDESSANPQTRPQTVDAGNFTLIATDRIGDKSDNFSLNFSKDFLEAG